MSSFWNRGTKTKKKFLVIEKIAYTCLLSFSVSVFYLFWDASIRQEWSSLGIYVTFYLLFLVLFVWIVRDIDKNYSIFVETEDAEGKGLLENIHFLCADPMCPRCGGWYFGVALSFTISITLKDIMIPVLRNFSYSQYLLIVAGAILFLVSTPIHGSLTFLKKIRQAFAENKGMKLVLGLVSGLSLTLIVMGILMILG